MSRPWCSTAIRCAIENTTCMSCSVKSSVRLRSRARWPISAIESRVSAADMPAVGSSSSRISGSSASAMPSSSCFWPPCESRPAVSCAFSRRPTASSCASVSSRKRRSTGPSMRQPRPRCETYAACTFSNTVRRGKMFWRWKERPMPRRHRRCGAILVTSRPLSSTCPESARRWPVIRLKSVVLPAPFGPMIALIEPRGTAKLTPSTARKPSKLFASARTSSTAEPRRETTERSADGAGDPAGKHEQQHDEDRAEDQRPVLGVGHDLLVQPDQGRCAHRRAEKRVDAAEERHDQDLGRLVPVREVREDAAVEDAEQAPGETRERAREHERRELVAPHVDADELRPLGILADRRQHAPERRGHDPSQAPQAGRDDGQADEIEVLGGPPAPDERHDLADRLEPREIRIRDLRHALLPASHLVPLEADRPHDLREREREHREVDPRQAHTEEAGGQREQRREQAGSREREQEREP